MAHPLIIAIINTNLAMLYEELAVQQANVDKGKDSLNVSKDNRGVIRNEITALEEELEDLSNGL